MRKHLHILPNKTLKRSDSISPSTGVLAASEGTERHCRISFFLNFQHDTRPSVTPQGTGVRKTFNSLFPSPDQGEQVYDPRYRCDRGIAPIVLKKNISLHKRQ